MCCYLRIFKSPCFLHTQNYLILPYFSTDIVDMVTVSTVFDGANNVGWESPRGAPPLLTNFIPPTECSTRWIYDTSLCSGAICSGIYEDFEYFSVAYPSYYFSCVPYGVAPTYSPGRCGDGQTLAAIYEIHFSDVDDIVWQGDCCNRYHTLYWCLLQVRLLTQ